MQGAGGGTDQHYWLPVLLDRKGAASTSGLAKLFTDCPQMEEVWLK